MRSRVALEELKRLEDFLRPSWIAIVGTIGPSGMAQLTPNWYSFSDGKLHVSTTKQRVKYRNLVRDGRLSVCVVSEPRGQNYASITGLADIRDDESIWIETRDIVERYVEPGRVESWIADLQKQDRVIISLKPERIVLSC